MAQQSGIPSLPLRRLIGAIAVVVGLATAVAIPAGYALTSYIAEADALAFKARLNAGRLAKYIYTHGELWPFHSARLAELIEIPEASEQDQIRQRIYVGLNRVVLEEPRRLEWPIFSRSAPVDVNGANSGRIEVAASLRPLILRTTTVAVFACSLATLIFLVLYRIPRRILDRTLSALALRDRELETQNYRFQLALQRMSQGLSMYDGQRRLLVCNEKYLEIYRTPADAVKPGTPFERVLAVRAPVGSDPADPERFAQVRCEALFHQQGSDDEVVLRDGRIVAISSRPTVDGGWISLHQDVTAAKRAEAERIQAAAETEQLRQQERAAEMANRSKSSFLATMSHEIRTPMNAVIGLTSSLLESDLSVEHRQTLVAIHESGESLLRILNDILDYSKLDAGRLEFEHIAFSPIVLVDHLVAVIGPRAASKGLAVRIVHDPTLPPALVGDAGRLRQVLMNLLSNAVKFTAVGEIRVSTRCLARNGERIDVEWAVADTGIGIPPERIATLFNDFVQADSSITRRYGGSGLGLAISKRIIEQMGGAITASSTPEAGSTFRISLSLPWADTIDLEEREDQGAVATLQTRIAALGRPLRILIAEDNPTNQLVTVRMLRDFDVVTQVAADGLEAIAAIERNAFDIIFMDMRMPEMDGLAATRAIRARGAPLAQVPIIALTANAFAQDIKACRDAGMTDFIAKPMRKHVMVDVILRALPAGPLLRHTADRTIDTPVAGANTPVPPSDNAEPTTIDLGAFDELVQEVGSDGVRQILSVFLADTRNRLARMRRLTCGHDRKQIEIEAHTLKGASGTFGLWRLCDLARDLEAGVDGLTERAYGDALDKLEGAFAAAHRRIPREFVKAA